MPRITPLDRLRWRLPDLGWLIAAAIPLAVAVLVALTKER